MVGSLILLFRGFDGWNSSGQEVAKTKEKSNKTLMEVNTNASKCAKDGGFPLLGLKILPWLLYTKHNNYGYVYSS